MTKSKTVTTSPLPPSGASTQQEKGEQVTVIARKGDTALVEWVDGEDVRRSVVPQAILTVDETGQAYCPMPEQGLVYGWPWEELIVLEATPVAVARELRKRGIWTPDDLKLNAMAAVAAFQTVYGWDVSRLFVALEQKNQEK